MRQGRAPCVGFTLIELLVVIVIVGVMFSFLALSIRGDSPEELLKTEAERLDRLIGIAQDEAVLRGMEYGIEVKPKGYRFTLLDGDQWKVIEDDRILRERVLEHDITIELNIENSEVQLTQESGDGTNTERLQPQIFLLSSGEITPGFVLSMSMFGHSTLYQINGKIDGEIETTNTAF